MFYLLYHSNNVLGVFDSLRNVESTISSLVHNKLTKVNNFNVIEYTQNVASVGTNVNNILKLPFNLNSDVNNNNIVDTNNKSTLINRDIFEQFSDNETTEEYNYDSTEMNNSDEDNNQYNDDQDNDNQDNDNNVVVEETEEQKERRLRREKRKNKLDYNIQILKNRKEKLEEGKRIFEIDKNLYLKFKKIKDENESFEIPPMFTKKYDVLKILEEESSLNFESFDQVYEKDVSNTKWSKLFSGNAKERHLLDITESESDNEN
jgi:hypothetical protein